MKNLPLPLWDGRFVDSCKSELFDDLCQVVLAIEIIESKAEPAGEEDQNDQKDSSCSVAVEFPNLDACFDAENDAD